ncbi:MAG: GlsB/YeaQ/YmgE family stress response membrane protein [Ramlibacter sp.]
MPEGGKVVMIESILVGIFGAFIGGEFIASMLNGGVVATTFQIGSLAISVACAVVMLFLLRLMRRAVGPMKASKKKVARRL